MDRLLRWGRSAHDTDDDVARLEGVARAHDLAFTAHEDASLPDVDPVRVLLVHSGVRVGAEALDALQPELLITTTSGFDHLDLAACRQRGTQVGRCPLARRDAVVEVALAGMIDGLRGVDRLSERARQGSWARAELPAIAGRLVRGSTVLVVGLGVIGRRMAEVLAALGAEVLGCDPRGVPPGITEVSLEEGLGWADAVTLHCRLEPGSRQLLDRDTLARLREGSVLVNTARGDLLDVEAAVEGVREGRISALFLDVFPEEPWPHLEDARDPRIRYLPHAAGHTRDLGERVAHEVDAALTAWRQGLPLPHPVH